MFSRLARPSSSNACVMRCAILRFWSGERPSTQVTCTCGICFLLLVKNAAHGNRCPRRKPTQKNPSARLRGRGLQFYSAVGAVAPTRLDRAVALRAGERQPGATMRTESELPGGRFSARRARPGQRVAQQEVEDDSDGVRNEDCQQRPHDVAHVAALGIAIDEADERNPHQEKERHSEGKQRLLPVLPKAHFLVARNQDQQGQQRKANIHSERDDPRRYGDYAQRTDLISGGGERGAVARSTLRNHASLFLYVAHANLPS